MANEFRVKNGLIIGDSIDGESLPVSGVVSNLSTASATDLVVGAGIRSYIDTTLANLTPDSVQFNTLATVDIDTAGEIAWDADNGTVSIGMNDGVVLQVGQEDLYYVKNKTGTTITNGTPVMFAGTDGASGTLLVTPAIGYGIDPSYIVGIVTSDIENDTFGYVTSRGAVRGIQTNGVNYGESWIDGDIIFVSPLVSGYLTKVRPDGPNEAIQMAAVVNSHASNGTLYVRPTWEDRFLSSPDVNADVTTTGDLLTWNQESGYFESVFNVSDISAAVLSSALKEPTGFDSTGLAGGQYIQDVLSMSFDVGLEQFTIQPNSGNGYSEYSYYYRGQRVTIDTSKTVSCPFSTSRQWWIVFNDANGTLQALSSLTDGAYTIIRDNVFVAELVWNVSGTALIKASVESHGLMPWETHLYNHSTIGTRYDQGLLVTPTYNTKNIGVEAGVIWDEDIRWETTEIISGAANNISVIWRTGSTWDGAQYVGGVKTTGGQPQYNEDSGGGNWVLTTVGTSDFVCVHYFATPDFAGNEIFAVVGQAVYNSASDARQGALSELLALDTSGLPFPEYKAIATAVVDSLTGDWDFEYTDATTNATIIDWRYAAVGSATAATVTDHGSLTGLTDDDHTQYVLANGTRDITGDIDINSNGLAGDRLTLTATGHIISYGPLPNLYNTEIDHDSVTFNNVGSAASVEYSANSEGGSINLTRPVTSATVTNINNIGNTALVTKQYTDTTYAPLAEGVTDGDYGDITVSSSNTVWTIDANTISDTKLRDSAALSVIGRATATTGDPADITAGTDGHVLRRSGTSLGFGTVATAGITNDAITNTKLANMAQSTIKGRAASAGTGDPVDLTAAQVRTIINVADGAEPKPELTKSIYISDPIATDDIGIWEPGVAITITKVVHKTVGATVTYNINHSGGTDLWSADEVASTTREAITTFTDATCTANNYIRYQASAIGTTPTAIEITITYTED